MTSPKSSVARRLRELAIVLAGAFALHFALLWPSLVGDRVMLPADLLSPPTIYLPPPEDGPPEPPLNTLVTDLVYTLALHGDLAREQIRDGRWPLWNPYSYCGAPLLGAAQGQALSPFSLVQLAMPLEFPRTLAWAQLLRACVAAFGAFLCFRRTFRTRAWPATFGAWAWTLSGFATMWTGFPHAEVVLELPLLVFAIERTISRPRGFGLVALALVVALMLVAGHPSTAATAFLGAAAIGAWLWWTRTRPLRSPKRALGAAAAVAAGFALGVALSGPQTTTTLEYLPLTLRANARAEGYVDIPPAGLHAAPLFALPWSQGSNLAGDVWLLVGNHIESAAGGYVGLAMLLVLAPLAFARRRASGVVVHLALCALVFAGQRLGLPGIVQLCEAWPLRVLQNNRAVLVTGFCVLTLAVIGLDRAWRGRIDRRAPAFVAMALLAVLAAWSVTRYASPPAVLTEWVERVRSTDPERTSTAAASFASLSLVGALMCAACIGLAAWIGLRRRPRKLACVVVAAFGVAELCWLHRAHVTQSPLELAYPRIPALQAVARDSSARMVGMNCLPAALNLSHRLRGVRGYDGLDPARICELLDLFRHPRAPVFSYAATQWFTPVDSPLLDLVGVRYLIHRGKPRTDRGVFATSPGYHVLLNDDALPRAFVPARVERVEEGSATLARLARPDFDPRAVAIAPPEAPAFDGETRGDARIEIDEPDRVVVRATLDSPGLLVLSDAWFPGWKAAANGREVEVLRIDHAFRGVALDAGESEVEFRYRPESFARGLALARAGALALAAWTLWILARDRWLARLTRSVPRPGEARS